MFQKLKIKPAKEHDAKKVARLFSAIDRKITPKKVMRLINEKKVYIMKDKKRIRAAFVYSVISILGFISIMYIHKLAVAPELQGQGIGTFILSRIRKNALKTGVVAIFLYSLDKAKRFYEKNHLKRIWRFFWCRPDKADY
ncbi:GNAT family N-acetyltransferase [Candidatus Peregrinibacteria bacterium]|nr:GNAT family N-acetyltransferase [Candidatus Peregrinibacteria bacterium]